MNTDTNINTDPDMNLIRRMKLRPIAKRFDPNQLRCDRQTENDLLVYNAIKTRDTEKLHACSNNKAIERWLKGCHALGKSMNEGDFIAKCQDDDIFCWTMSQLISKNASRQGTKDETTQIKICNEVSSKCGIRITQLSNKAFRANKKTGEIISSGKDADCFKSFDGKIEGKINGWLFLKIVIGSGGAQDYEFQEACDLCEWIIQYRQGMNETYILIIDTDQQKKFDIVKEKYKSIDNILIFNHYDFQTYILDHYYEEGDDDNI
jgi:hypothetical protein